MKNGKAEPVMATVPFKAVFLVGYTDMLPDAVCKKEDPWFVDPLGDDDPAVKIITDGSGTGLITLVRGKQ